jgi:hypothetical protein
MIYDRLGVPITEGAILYNMSRFDLECTLMAVTGLDVGYANIRVYGMVLEWEWDFCIGEDRAWSTLEHGIQHDYEIVGWYRR